MFEPSLGYIVSGLSGLQTESQKTTMTNKQNLRLKQTSSGKSDTVLISELFLSIVKEVGFNINFLTPLGKLRHWEVWKDGWVPTDGLPHLD